MSDQRLEVLTRLGEVALDIVVSNVFALTVKPAITSEHLLHGIAALREQLVEQTAKAGHYLHTVGLTAKERDALRKEHEARFRARIICMCGSTRFKQTWIAENARLTGEGKIVLSVGLWGHHEQKTPTNEQKALLDELHKRKIDLCDEVWVLDVGGYIGQSTRSEIAYATEFGKPVSYLSQELPGYTEPVDPVLEERDALAVALDEARERFGKILRDVLPHPDHVLQWASADWQRAALETRQLGALAIARIANPTAILAARDEHLLREKQDELESVQIALRAKIEEAEKRGYDKGCLDAGQKAATLIEAVNPDAISLANRLRAELEPTVQQAAAYAEALEEQDD